MKILYQHDPASPGCSESRKRLIDAAKSGAEIALFIDNSAFPEWLLFDGVMIANDHLYGWTSPCIGQGRRPPTLDRKHNEVVRCVYGTDGSTAVLRQCIRTGMRRDDIYQPVKTYRELSWSQLATSKEVSSKEAGLRPHGLRCSLNIGSATFIFRPPIIYFGDGAKPGSSDIASIKSSEITIPASLILGGSTQTNGFCDVMLYASHQYGSRAILKHHWPLSAPQIIHSEAAPTFYVTS